jgi:hypothetical protein
MLIPTLPLDYAALVDVTERVRRTRHRPSGNRMRRAVTRDRTMP